MGRLLLNLLICLPLLVPPGACVCWLVPHRHAEVAPATKHADEDADPAPRQRTCCCQRKAKTETETTTTISASATEPGWSAPAVPPAEEEHDQACPALRPADYVRTCVKAEAAPLFLLAAVSSLDAPALVPTVQPPYPQPVPPPIPLYLAHHIILI